ncbi:hypothetical protein DITRI_Ditri12bG0037900 [Diplodiscus trichospermus]
MGDFNDHLSPLDKRGGVAQLRWLLNGFREVVEDCGLHDLGWIGYRFTWERGRGTYRWVQERLDMGLGNHDWCRMFPDTRLFNLVSATSDHAPIFLHVQKRVYQRRSKSFKFENAWLRESKCKNVVVRSWENNVGFSVQERLFMCGKDLMMWGEELTQDFQKRLAYCRREMSLL